MICPDCGARLSDGTLTCPICRRDLGGTHRIPRAEGIWCPSCGALIPEGDGTCPKCDLPAPGARPARPVRAIRLPKITDADSTSEFSAIQIPGPDEEPVVEARSAIPPQRGNEDLTLGYDHMARVRLMVIAALASLLVVGGAILFITHPFDPGKYDQRAREEADTSMVGSPGRLDSLSGQDMRGSAPDYDVSAATYDLLHDSYNELAELAQRLDEEEAYFLENYLSEDEEVRRKGYDSVEQLSLDISNLIDSVSQLGPSSDYAEDIDNMISLGNWLRNRSDVLLASWEIDLGYLAPALVQDVIDETYYSDKDDEGVSSYKLLFDENYAAWEPKEAR
ncbi:hypothetical protein EII22_01205 [Coriobacteriales bacterium OH1046]|nr:hypothetical protein EII22_01205 [Coriobacteriales bacterium OH1046]